MSIRYDSVERIGPRKVRPYEGTYEPLDEAAAQYMRSRFELFRLPHDYVGQNTYGKYVFALKGPIGQHRGYQVRNVTWGDTHTGGYPKSSTFMVSPNDPVQAFYSATAYTSTTPIVIVEDPVSALKVIQAGLNAVALLGVVLTMDKVREIANLRRPVIFAYDKDATEDSFRHLKEWGSAFTKASIKMLETDIKDMPRDEVGELFGEYNV